MLIPRMLLLALLAAPAAPAGAQTLDGFDGGLNPQGWSGLVSSGGHPGWCLERVSPVFPPFGSSNAVGQSTASAPWKGDWRGAQVTELKFDIYNDYGATDGMVLISNQGSGQSAAFEFYGLPLGWSTLSVPIPATGQPATGWNVSFPPGYTWNEFLGHVSGVEVAFFYWAGFGSSATARVDNIEIVHAPGFHLYASDLQAAGQTSTLTALGGTRGGLVGFGASVSPGATAVSCTGAVITSGLSAPRILGVVPTDDYGHAHLTAVPGAGLSGTTLHLQALDVATCTLSNVAQVTLP